MGFSATAGRILITDATGDVTLDTDERQFVWTDFVQGTHVCPQRVASSQFGALSPVQVDLDTVLGSINAAADTVFGALRVTYSGVGGPDFDSLANEGWFQATGSYMAGLYISNGTGALDGGRPQKPWGSCSGIIFYTFRASGGQLIFNEQVQVWPYSRSLGSVVVSSTVEETTVDFKLYCGTFV